MNRSIAAAALVAVGLGTAAPASPEGRGTAAPRYGEPAVIDFAGHGGIRDWYASDERNIYLMDRAGRWYLATLSGPCRGLRTNPVVGFETDVTGRFDTFSAVRTRFNRCHVNKLVYAPRPAAKGGSGRN